MMKRITQTLLEMLAIDSDNLAPKDPIVGYATEWLRELGMEVTITGPETTPAILARNGRGGLALSGHLDTVPLGEGWSHPQGHMEGGRIYRRGASDMKETVAATLEASCTLVEEGVPFSVLLTTDEEEGMEGALSLSGVDALDGTRGIIIGEPTGMRVARREKGVCRLKLTTRGRAGHSSQPWMGDNAIYRMQSVLGSLEDMLNAPSTQTDGRTATLTTLRGGTKNNVIPESCTAEIDIRFPPEESVSQVKRMIEGRLEGHECERETTAELSAFQIMEGSRLLEEALRQLDTETFSASFATEAARFAPHQPDIIVCGPGMPGTCHIVDEWVEIEKLELFHDFLLHMARTFAQG
jgi:acetylornithine deacetylase/succinyl-diaminopimelate desuccinylase-like protein